MVLVICTPLDNGPWLILNGSGEETISASFRQIHDRRRKGAVPAVGSHACKSVEPETLGGGALITRSS